ncbi:MAG: response regulator transcription factor [Anaerolineae bacterium]|nr:response regulator transcription factor [Anaerolineae bacterium]NUQ04214.1 response regulator transcription factor [Anaerolineae bacterium]
MATIRVMIVDDHGMVRFGLRGYIETMPGLKVVGEAGSGEEALRLLETSEVDIILMDLVLPGMSGAEATRIIAERYPAVRVIIMTSFIDSAHVLPAIRAGAAGYLLKDILPDDLAKAVIAIHKGQSVMHPKVIAQIAANLAPANQNEIDLVQSLSERELDVLRLLTRGLQNHEIAVELSVSENTVRTHVSNLLTKLDLRDRTQAALFGVRFFEYLA